MFSGIPPRHVCYFRAIESNAKTLPAAAKISALHADILKELQGNSFIAEDRGGRRLRRPHFCRDMFRRLGERKSVEKMSASRSSSPTPTPPKAAKSILLRRKLLKELQGNSFRTPTLLAIRTARSAHIAARGGICKDLFVKTSPFTARPKGSISSPRPEAANETGEDRSSIACKRLSFPRQPLNERISLPVSAAERANPVPHVSR